MHTAAAPPRKSGLAAEQFGHQLTWVSPLRQRVPMPAMRAKDRIVYRQVRTHGRRDCLLANVGVTRAQNQPALMTPREFFFRLPDDLHRAVKAKRLVVGYWSLLIGHLEDFAHRERAVDQSFSVQDRWSVFLSPWKLRRSGCG